MHVSSQPYLKTYFFPLWSLGTLVRVTFLTLAVVLPFFMTYSTPNFFLTSRLQVYNQTIAYSYQYHITITTTSSRYIYTNLYQTPTSNPPTITQQDSKQVMQFGIEWPHAPSENVRSLEVSLFFNFERDGVTHFGSATAKSQGYSLGQVSIAGPLTIAKGPGSTALTSSSLALVGYDLTVFAQKAQTSAGYLKYDYSVLPVNIPSDLFKVRLVLNHAGLVGLQQTPSVLGQLVWSWVQYFPIFLSIFWALDKIFAFLVREKIVNRKVVHDGEYTQLISAEARTRQSRGLH